MKFYIPIRCPNFCIQNRLAGLFFLQGFVVGLLALLSMVIFGWVPALSSFLGGFTCCITTYGMSCYFFKPVHATTSPKQMVKALYLSEIGKWILSIGVFAELFKYQWTQAAFFLITYFLAQNVFWFAPFFMKEVNNRHG